MDKITVCLAGCGSIGTVLAEYIDKDESFDLAYVLDEKNDSAKSLIRKLKNKPKCVDSIHGISGVDLVIEAASQDFVRENALKVLEKSDLMVMSVGAFSDTKLFDKVKAKASENHRKVYIPSGAIPGLDGINAAGIAGLRKVTLVTRKPPRSLKGTPGADRFRIGMDAVTRPMVIYEGNAEEAARMFPKNINVSVALSLAGLGVRKTSVRVIADPFTKDNIHEIEAEGRFGKMTIRTENRPSPKNRKTSYLAALSAIATLKKLTESVQIGT